MDAILRGSELGASMPLVRGQIIGYDATLMVFEFTMIDKAVTAVVECQISSVAMDQLAVRERRLADDIVPLVAGKLAGDKRGAVAVAVLDDFHQIAPLVGGEPVRSPVVE